MNLRSLPREGRANEELREYLAEVFDLDSADVELVSGHRNTRKTVKLRNLDRDRLVATVQSLDRS